jgi:hypothetical protein
MELLHVPYEADVPEAAERLLTAVADADARATGSGVIEMPEVSALPLQLLHGDWDTAAAQGRRMAESSYYAKRGTVVRCLAWLAYVRGDRESAAASVVEVLPRGAVTEPGKHRFHHATEAQRLAATLALDVGDHASARQWLEAHDRWLAWGGAVLGQSGGHALWGEYHRQAGDMDAAYAHAQSALAHATEPRQPLALLAAHRLLGELDIEAGRYDDAADHLGASLHLADACQAP